MCNLHRMTSVFLTLFITESSRQSWGLCIMIKRWNGETDKGVETESSSKTQENTGLPPKETYKRLENLWIQISCSLVSVSTLRLNGRRDHQFREKSILPVFRGKRVLTGPQRSLTGSNVDDKTTSVVVTEEGLTLPRTKLPFNNQTGKYKKCYKRRNYSK